MGNEQFLCHKLTKKTNTGQVVVKNKEITTKKVRLVSVNEKRKAKSQLSWRHVKETNARQIKQDPL